MTSQNKIRPIEAHLLKLTSIAPT